jgi:hypothetical protein
MKLIIRITHWLEKSPILAYADFQFVQISCGVLCTAVPFLLITDSAGINKLDKEHAKYICAQVMQKK